MFWRATFGYFLIYKKLRRRFHSENEIDAKLTFKYIFHESNGLMNLIFEKFKYEIASMLEGTNSIGHS